MIAPGILPKLVDYPGAERILVNVPNEFQQIAVLLHDDGPVSSFEKVTRAPILFVERFCIPAGQ